MYIHPPRPPQHVITIIIIVFYKIIAYKFSLYHYKFIKFHCCIRVCSVCVLDNINITSGNEVSRS